MRTDEAATLLELVRGVWPNQQIGEDVARAWAWALESVTAEEAGAALKTIIAEGTSDFAPNPTRILDAVMAARPKTLWISPNATPQANTETHKIGDRYYVRATASGRAEYEEAMRKRGMEKVITGHHTRPDGRKEVSFVYRKI